MFHQLKTKQHERFQNPTIHQERARSLLFPYSRPTRSCQPPYVVGEPLQALTQGSTRPRLSEDIQMALATRGKTNNRSFWWTVAAEQQLKFKIRTATYATVWLASTNVVPLQCKQKGVCPEHISKASRNLIINFNNQNTMKDTKNKETLKTVLQFIVSVLTALLATLGVQSCISI